MAVSSMSPCRKGGRRGHGRRRVLHRRKARSPERPRRCSYRRSQLLRREVRRRRAVELDLDEALQDVVDLRRKAQIKDEDLEQTKSLLWQWMDAHRTIENLGCENASSRRFFVG